jgi:hypothetical protein
MFLTTSNSGAFDAGVSESGTNFAITETATPGSASHFGVNGSGWSPSTYANNASITITLKTRSNDTGYTVDLSAGALVYNTGMDITVQTSN